MTAPEQWLSSRRRAARHPLRAPRDRAEWLAERRWDLCVDAIMSGQATAAQCSAWMEGDR